MEWSARVWLWITSAVLTVQSGLSFSRHAQQSYAPGFMGRYPGRCRGDGMYYRDSYSFVTCTHGIAYLQPCPPGTRNKDYGLYSADSAHFCTENLVNMGYTVQNQHPPHGLHSLRRRGRKRRRYHDQRPQQHHVRRARAHAYMKPHARMYHPPAPAGMLSQAPHAHRHHRPAHHHPAHRPAHHNRHHHTGPEVHGPYRDQAKETLASLAESAGRIRPEVADRHEISTGLEHPLLTLHQKFQRPTLEAHHVKLVKPRKTHRRRHLVLPGDARSLPLPSSGEPEDEEYLTASTGSYHGDADPKPRLVDPTRIQLIPPKERWFSATMQRPAPSYEEAVLQAPRSETTPRLAELKRRIIDHYDRAHRNRFQRSAFDPYALVANDQSKARSRPDLLLTVVGRGNEILSYKTSPEYKNARKYREIRKVYKRLKS